VAGWRTSSGAPGFNRLDKNFLGKLGADAQAHIANLANDVRMLREQANFLFFAEAHFPQPVLYFRGGGELLDANGSSGPNVTQRTDEWLRAIRVRLSPGRTVIHGALTLG
jgi:hypothetical protein